MVRAGLVVTEVIHEQCTIHTLLTPYTYNSLSNQYCAFIVGFLEILLSVKTVFHVEIKVYRMKFFTSWRQVPVNVSSVISLSTEVSTMYLLG